MRLYSQYNKIIIAVLIVLLGGACKKFVEIDPPINQLSTSNLFLDNATATSAQVAIYNIMNSEGYTLEQNTGFLGDELKNWSTQQNLVQFYTNSLSALTSPGPWKNAWNYIYQANAILEGLSNNSTLSPAIIKQLSGESRFIRAFWYFYLTNIYADVPLITSTDYSKNDLLPRSKQSDIYNQIIFDLKYADSLLNVNFVDASDTVITPQRIRPSKGSAEALLARVYLYTGDNANAVIEASKVINSSLFKLQSKLSDVFLANNNTEAIWQLQTPLPNTINTIDGNGFILIGRPSTTGANNATISDQLLNAFEINDKRKSTWIHDTLVSGVDYTYPFKYKVYQSPTISEYTIVLRLAEQYLIRAEANAELGNTPDVLNDLNTIRIRAGLGTYSGSTDKVSLLSAILHERQVELFTEWGHRWFDLRRSGKIDSVMNVVCPLKGAKWNSNSQWYPIPQTEIAIDPNLSQNIGY